MDDALFSLDALSEEGLTVIDGLPEEEEEEGLFQTREEIEKALLEQAKSRPERVPKEVSERLLPLLEKLLNDKKIDYSQYSREELCGVVIGVSIHRRQIRTKTFNELLRHCQSELRAVNQEEVRKISQWVDKLLDRFKFNFKDSEISLDYSDSMVSSLLEQTRAIRLTHPRILAKIEQLAKKVVSDLEKNLGFVTIEVDDIKMKLFEYLATYGESKYDPRKSAYMTFATMILDFRAKFLFKEMMTYYSTTRFVDFGVRRTDSDEDYCGVSERVKADTGPEKESHEVDLTVYDPTVSDLVRKEAREKIFNELTPLEKAVLYLEAVLSTPIGAYPMLMKHSEQLSLEKICKKFR